MNTPIEQSLLDKLKALPPERIAEVRQFVDLLAASEEWTAAGVRLGDALGRLDALGLPPLSDEDIESEIRAARRGRGTRSG